MSAIDSDVSEISADMAQPDRPSGSPAAPAPDLPAHPPFALPEIVCVAVIVAAVAWVGWPLLRWWYWEFTREDGYYNHAPIIPLLSALMLWHRRDRLKAVPIRPSLPAVGVFVASLALLMFAVKIEMEAVMSTAFLLTVTSGIWAMTGAKWMRVAAFPVAFLWLMAPLPGPVLNDMTLGMQSLSTVLAAKILHLIGLSSSHQGNYIYMENYRLNVDVPCSGFKLLLRLLTFSAAFADLSETTRVRQWGIFLFSLPLSLFINALRIALIGLVGNAMGASAAHTFHDWSGLITTILCMAILLGFARSLGCRRFAGQPIF